MSGVPGQPNERGVHPVLPDAAPPATAPRQLPVRVRAAQLDQRSMWVGGAFAVISAPFLILIISELPLDASGWLETSPILAMFAYGLWMLSGGLWGRSKRRRIYRRGKSAVATIVQGSTVDNIQEDGLLRQSFLIEWEFAVDGRAVRGHRESKDERIADLQTGDSIWVLYDPEDPDNNVEWPPL